MKRKQALRKISFWIAILMLALQIPFAAIADDVADAVGALTGGTADAGAESTAIVETAAPDAGLTLGPDELPWETLQDLRPEDVARPAAISLETALEKQHVNRLYAQETNLRTVIYQNKDGGKTTYIFNHPVKYVDSTGAIRDKSAVLTVQSDGAYAMEDNSTQAYFPKNLKNGGVTVTYGAYSIAMVPNTLAIAAAAALQGGKVLYGSAFGPGTALQYETTLYGVKEDIVLARAPSTNRFSFSMRLVGLTPARIGGEWVLQNAEGVTVAALGEVLVKDSAGRRILGDMAVTATASAGVYTLTLTVPQEFLADSETTYPVYVDPTITIQESRLDDYDTLQAIRDTGIYYGDYFCDYAYDDESHHYVGGQESMGYGGIIYNLYDFYGTFGLLKELTASELGSVKLYFHAESGSPITLTTQTLAEPYNTTENVVVDNDFFEYIGQGTSRLTLGASEGNYALDITDIARAWANYNKGINTNSAYNPANGFLVRSSDDSVYRAISSAESLSHSVYLVVDYTYYSGIHYINNAFSSTFLYKQTGENLRLSTGIFEDNEQHRFMLNYFGNDLYSIRANDGGSSYLYASGENVLLGALPATGITNAYKWEITTLSSGGTMIKNLATNTVLAYTLDENQNVVIKLIPAVGTTHADYSKTVWRILAQDAYVHMQDFTLGDNWLAPGATKHFQIISSPSNVSWTNDTDFSYTLTGTGFYMAVDGTLSIVGSTTPGIATLTVTHKPSNIQKTFSIYCDINPDDAYYINNIQQKYFIDQNTDGSLGLEDLENGVDRWVCTLENGYYKIRKYGTNLYLTSPTNTAVNADIELLPWNNSISDRQLWKVTKLSGQTEQPTDPRIIQAKHREGTNLVLGFREVTGFVHARFISQVDQTDLTFINDSRWIWYSESTCINVNLDVIFDQAYANRVENEFERITSQLIALQERYLHEFGIWVDFEVPTPFFSYMDSECSTDPDAVCNHGGVGLCDDATCETIHDSHHSDYETNVYQLPIPDLTQNVLLVYFGHEMCSVIDGEHKLPTKYAGLSICEYGISTVCYHNNLNKEERMTLHEFGHQFYAPDHYGDLGTETTDQINERMNTTLFKENCIYGETPTQQNKICEGCMNEIEKNKNRFNHD